MFLGKFENPITTILITLSLFLLSPFLEATDSTQIQNILIKGRLKVIRKIDGKKKVLRQNVTRGGSPKGLPKKTGNFEEDADAFFDTVNVT